MRTSTEATVRPGTPETLPETSAALAQAFRDDPVATWVTPDPLRREAMLAGFFPLVMDRYLRHGSVHVLADGSGAALWASPGVDLVPPDDQETFGERMYETIGDDADRVFEVMALTDAHHPSEPCFTLGFLGVVPEHQGGGLGSALMVPVLERCDRDGIPAYLEASTADSRRLYERHGFVTVGEITVPRGPTLWPMRRDPVPMSRS